MLSDGKRIESFYFYFIFFEGERGVFFLKRTFRADLVGHTKEGLGCDVLKRTGA